MQMIWGWMVWAWRWLDTNHEPVKIVFAVVAATFVVGEYAGRMNESATAKTLEYVKRFNESEVAAARKKLDAFWDQQSSELWSKKLNKTNYYAVVPQLIRESGLISEVRTLGNFYREVGLCVQGKICSAPKACHFFFSDVQGFMHNYKWYLDHIDPTLDRTPKVLTALVTGACSSQQKSYCQENPGSPYCPIVT